MSNAQSEDPSIVVEVVSAVAAREGVDVTVLPPLYDVINVDKLNTLFDRTYSNPLASSVSVSFEYYGYTVTIEADRTITIE